MTDSSPFERIQRLLGVSAMERLSRARVAVFGLGGVGGQCVEALARSSVGRFLLVDGDTVAPSNLNRQIVALHSTLGMPKTEAMRARILDINPGAEVEIISDFYRPDAPADIWGSPLDLVIDAIDDIPAKVDIALQTQERGVPCVSCMGAGNKLDPMRFEAADLYGTSVCPLCRAMRKRARESGIRSLRVIYSKEPPAPLPPLTECPEKGARAPGSVVFATAAAGLLLAAEAVRMLLGPDWPQM